MSAVLPRTPACLYREEQNFAWWVYALVAGGCFLVVMGIRLQRGAIRGMIPPLRELPSLQVPIALLVGVVLPAVIAAAYLHMTTEVGPGLCRVWYGWLPTIRRDVSLAGLERVEVVQYTALREHGFWGLHRTRDGEHVMTARGDRGVRLVFTDGSRVLIGSQRPEELAAMLERERMLA